MNRPAIIILRVLAIGLALAAITCQVANRQQLANGVAASGDRGPTGPAARPTWAPSSKSIDSLIVPARPPVPATVPTPPKQVVSAEDSKESARHFRQGLHYYDVGRFVEAQAEFQSVLAIDPQNAAARHALARARHGTSPKPVATPTANPAPPPPAPPARPAAPRYLPGSKSARIVTPEDVRQLQQRSHPQSNQAPAQQSANRRP